MTNLTSFGGESMTKRLLLILLSVALVVSLVAFAACAKEEEPPVEEEEEEEEVWEWPERLLTLSMSTRSPVYGALVGWTTPWSQDTGVPVRIINEADSRLHGLWVKEGRFFTKAPHQSRSMLYGAEGFTRRDWGPWQSRIWYPAGISYWGGVTLGDSGIETPYDIKPGMKANLVTLGEEPQQSIMGIVAWGNVNPEDIVWVPLANTAQNARFLMDGKSDFTFTYHTTPSWYEVEASPHGLTWIPLDWENDPEGAERFLSIYPWTTFDYATGGLPTAEGVPMCKNISPYITSADTDPELVYRIVKWLDENYDKYKDSNPWCKAMTIDNLLALAESNYEPIHEGSVRYLREKGLWTDELEAKRQYNIEQLTLWVEAYQAAIDMADERGIAVDPDNEEWQELWENYRASLDLPLLVYFQNAENQPGYYDFYEHWNQIKPTW